LELEVFRDAGAVAERAAEIVVAEARMAVSLRGRFTLAVSGGQTPGQMLRTVAEKEMPWENVFVFQVDERVVPEGDPKRNLTLLRETLLKHVPLRPSQVFAMPVELPDLKEAAETYAATLRRIAGEPAVLDLVHLGLGTDGHTASLVPGDPVLDVDDRDVAVTGIYQGSRRITLTYPILNRSRRVLWVVTGREKEDMLARLRHKDETIPAGRVRQDRALVLAS
jgi:6-phosphogluconolactonase